MITTAEEYEWMSKGVCRDLHPDAMFPRFASQQKTAAKACDECPVRAECLAYALEHREDFGVRGGKTARQRRSILRRMAPAA